MPQYDVRVLLHGLHNWTDVVRLSYDAVSGEVSLRLASHAAVRYFKRYYDGGYIEWSRGLFEPASASLRLSPSCTLPHSQGELQHKIADQFRVNWRSVHPLADGHYRVDLSCAEAAVRAMKRWYEELDGHRIPVPVALYVVEFERCRQRSL